MVKNRRNGNIEILRFVFAVGIVLYHCSFIYYKLPFHAGYLGVEFFLMVTGVFLGKRIKKELADKEKTVPSEDLSDSFHSSFKLIVKRISVLFPYLLPSIVIGWCVNCVFNEGLKSIFSPKVIFLLTEFLFLRSFGFQNAHATWVDWYLSAMLISLFFLYVIAKRHYHVYVKYISLIVALSVVGLLNHEYGSTNVNTNILFGFVNVGVLRAFAMISFGLFVNHIAEKISEIQLKSSVRWFLTILDIVLYLVVFFYFSYSNGYYDHMVIIFLAMALLLTISKQSFLYGKFDNRVSTFLGKFSMVLFLNHNYWAQNMESIVNRIVFLQETVWWQRCAIIFGLSIVTSFIVLIIGYINKQLFSKIKWNSIVCDNHKEIPVAQY